MDLAGYSNPIGALTGSGTITNNLHLYQIDNGTVAFAFNNTLFTEAEDDWVGNVFTATAGGTRLSSISFFYNGGFGDPINNLPSPLATAALYLGSPDTGLTLVPGSVNTAPINANAGEWIVVPFAAVQSVSAGQVFTAVVLINNVPASIFPFTED